MRGKGAAMILLAMMAAPAAIALGQARTAEVKGTVVHHNQRPAVNCVVRIGGRFNYVDGNGRFRLFRVPSGKQTLSVTCGRRVDRQETVFIHGPVETLPKIVLSH